ncbi:hypothetical protein DICPUDRAFT_86844 [Dictyostelium purpureum]|uniref:Lariat debranching enzyme C-terminal domain-containing protein n=1 Tax=Dictyostelium purpureum TaxID=5786 RepID=F0ZE98_DICPU|nr:uncharacterized protein DICPUDRAFT_86844 [Dictyostelium purpureum]EGC37717.1 hypothetical protein DICPUDRAFT_86844 [Dictyostelium purpureum]|eukprot:XP_003285738.1 hypothetical protein DICPUDRAFT_86844 [Dictyostelium purpureum]
MKIAIEGCCHGEIETIYNSLVNIEKVTNSKVDLLICCGDYEALRNQNDLKSLAVKPKYRTMGSFYKYYSGKVKAPILTLVVGGNHESSNYFSELNDGGWLCENIYYMGRSNVVNFGGLRIGGISGIFKEYDYQKGYFETKPFSENHQRSIYHLREFDVFKMMQLGVPRLDIVFSHDWPLGIVDYGNKEALLRFKKGLIENIENGELGNPATMALLKHLKPKFWFSAHLHVKFAALYPHVNENDQELIKAPNSDTDDSNNVLNTRFLALDKVLPNRDFLQVLQFEEKAPLKLCYDPQWLIIQSKTKHIKENYTSYNPQPLDPNLFTNLLTPEDIEKIEGRLIEIYKLKNNINDNNEITIQDALEIKQENYIKNTYCHDPDNFSPLTYLPPAFENPQDIVYQNLLKVISNDSPITPEIVKELDVNTYAGNLEEIQKEQLKANQEQRQEQRQEKRQHELQQQYKDDAEISLDD